MGKLYLFLPKDAHCCTPFHAADYNLGKVCTRNSVAICKKAFRMVMVPGKQIKTDSSVAMFHNTKACTCLFGETKHSTSLLDGIFDFPESRPYPATPGSNSPRYGLHSFKSVFAPSTEYGY